MCHCYVCNIKLPSNNSNYCDTCEKEYCEKHTDNLYLVKEGDKEWEQYTKCKNCRKKKGGDFIDKRNGNNIKNKEAKIIKSNKGELHIFFNRY